MKTPTRGDVWTVDLDPTRGREQSGTRPALVISEDVFNQSAADLVIVLPITSKGKSIRSHVEVLPPEGGLTMRSYIKCEDVRTVAKERLIRQLGTISAKSLSDVEYRLRTLMGL